MIKADKIIVFIFIFINTYILCKYIFSHSLHPYKNDMCSRIHTNPYYEVLPIDKMNEIYITNRT